MKTVAGTTYSYTYDTTKNRLASVTGGYSFGYDDRGNVTNNGKRGFSFNRANQLVQSASVSYVYDGYNRRVRQSNASGNHYSVYDAKGTLKQRLTSANARVYSVYLGKQLIAERELSASSNTTRYQHTDVLGSVVGESDSAAALTRSVYQPFGERLGGQKSGIGFTGHLEDPDLGLTYMQARYYDPVIGRFYSNDPVGFKSTLNFNRYSYANNNPYKFIDPDGRDAEITLNKNGSIKIEIPIKFSGSGATPQNVSSIKSEVSKTWSGSYNIDGKETQVSVSITDVSSVGPTNDITLTNGPTSDVFSGGDSFVDGTNTGEWRTDSGGITDGTISHEAGHLMGIGDKYLGSTPGYESNIMGNKSGKPDGRNIKEAINSNANWKKGGK